jgi:phospholipid N-methyltransferase
MRTITEAKPAIPRFLDSFKTIWAGGYFEGDPLDPMAPSGYGIFGYHSSLYVAFLTCIKPYVRPGVTVLEIGPGRGAWTRAILSQNPAAIYAVDVVDPDYAGFWSYVGRDSRIRHIITQDQSLADIPDGSIDHFFSFGCFCHIKPEMCVDYINSLARKMRPGANGFLMIADYDKFNACMAQVGRRSVMRSFVGQKFALVRTAFRLSKALFPRKFIQKSLDKTEAESTAPGAWFHLGVPNACRALEAAGFEIMQTDMQINHRDPVIHFRNPRT